MSETEFHRLCLRVSWLLPALPDGRRFGNCWDPRHEKSGNQSAFCSQWRSLWDPMILTLLCICRMCSLRCSCITKRRWWICLKPCYFTKRAWNLPTTQHLTCWIIATESFHRSWGSMLMGRSTMCRVITTATLTHCRCSVHCRVCVRDRWRTIVGVGRKFFTEGAMLDASRGGGQNDFLSGVIR